MENKLIAKSFMWMFIGLLVTFLTGGVICLNQEKEMQDGELTILLSLNHSKRE